MTDTVNRPRWFGLPARSPVDVTALYGRDGARKYLNRAERQRALAAMEKLEPRKALLALTLAWTGARVSEVLALTRASLQPDQAIVTFRTLKRRRLCLREVPIPPALMASLDVSFISPIVKR